MKNKSVSIKLLFFFFLLCCQKPLFSAAYLESDNDQPNIDTVFRIIITSTDPNIGNNTSPNLEQVEQNFEILNQSQQTSQYIINGKRESKVKWILTVIPKKSGKVKIDSITLGSEYTNPLNFNITNRQSKNSGVKKFNITVSADESKSNYINSAIPITVKALIFKEQQIDNLNLHTPEQPDIHLIKLDDFKTEKYINNKPYIVYTLKYLLFAQKPNKLLLPSFALSGNELIPESTADDMFGFQRYYKRPFKVQSNKLELNIKDIPSNWKDSNWFSADKARIQEEYSPKNFKSLKQGDALTRTVIITAINADNTALPNEIMTKQENNKYKVYVDNPEYKQTIKNNKIYSTLTQTATFIFNKDGTMEIPEIKIPWWNLIENKIEFLVTPAQNINIRQVKGFNDNKIEPKADVINPEKKLKHNSEKINDLKETVKHNKTSNNEIIKPEKKSKINYKWYQVPQFINDNITNNKLLIIFYILLILVISLVITTLIFYFLYKKQKNFITYIKARKYGASISSEYKQKIKNHLISLRVIEENLYMSCQNDMPHDIYYNISLIAEYFNISVNKIIRTADSELKELLQQLQEMLFSKNNYDFEIDGELFYKLYKDYKKNNLNVSKKGKSNNKSEFEKF